MSADASLLGAYFALVKVLHKKKVIHIDDLVAELGNTIDFADLKKMDNPSRKYDMALYDSLRQIAEAFARVEKK